MSMQHTSVCNEGENEPPHSLLTSIYLRYTVKSQLSHLPIHRWQDCISDESYKKIVYAYDGNFCASVQELYPKEPYLMCLRTRRGPSFHQQSRKAVLHFATEYLIIILSYSY